MTDLADLAFDVAGDLPVQVRKVIGTALDNGWELNKPGMTLALRLNHPTDELAQPVYILWAVSKTPTGRMSFKFVSCGTKGLVPLSGADLLEYLADPTVAYMTEDDIAEADAKRKEKERKPWDDKADAVTNLRNVMGAEVVSMDPLPRVKPPWERNREVKPSIPVAKATPLRIKIPGV